MSASLEDCRQCPRLVKHHLVVQQQYPDYHAHPVGAWGAYEARILVVGLAPGLHGACRTGRAFVGDDSGRFLFAGLHRTGLATSSDPMAASLVQTRITNVVKCLPPGNAPLGSELKNCSGHLAAELKAFGVGLRVRRPRAIVALGGVAYQSVCRALGLPVAGFAHGARVDVSRRVRLFACFHPSRLNVNTRRITPDMLDDVLSAASGWVQSKP